MKNNTSKILIFGMLLFIAGHAGFSQGFVNLDFESAHIISTSGPLMNSIATTNAVPGWLVFLGSNQVTSITYDNPAVGSTWVSLVTSNDTYDSTLSGNFSVLLQGGLTFSSATISQTGFVPIGAQSLLFEAQQDGAGTLDVSLDGQILNYFAISTGSNYTLYGADISGFSGQTETLAFSALHISEYHNDWNLDNIQFSSSPVPEPSALGLSALGGLLLACRRRVSA